jgi:hypothetical protein
MRTMTEVMRAVVTEIENLQHTAEFISAIMAVRAALPSMSCPNDRAVLTSFLVRATDLHPAAGKFDLSSFLFWLNKLTNNKATAAQAAVNLYLERGP